MYKPVIIPPNINHGLFQMQNWLRRLFSTETFSFSFHFDAKIPLPPPITSLSRHLSWQLHTAGHKLTKSYWMKIATTMQGIFSWGKLSDVFIDLGPPTLDCREKRVVLQKITWKLSRRYRQCVFLFTFAYNRVDAIAELSISPLAYVVKLPLSWLVLTNFHPSIG